MPSDRAARELSKLLNFPTIFMDQRTERERTINHAPRDHDFGPMPQRRRNREGAQISVDAGQPSRKIWKIAPDQIVACYAGYIQANPQFGNPRPQQTGKSCRINRTRIRDYLCPRFRNPCQMRADMHIHEISRKPAARICHPQPAHQSHRTFGKIVENNIIDPCFQKLGDS